MPQRVCEQPRGFRLGVAPSVPSGEAGLVPSQDRTQLWAAGAALPEAQRAGCTEGKKTCYCGFYWAACPNRGDVVLAKASSCRASSVGNRGFLLQLPTLEEESISLP